MGKSRAETRRRHVKWRITLLIILAVAFFLRLPLLDSTIVFDEYVQTKAVMEHNLAGLDLGTQIPPMTTWVRIFFSWAFGLSTATLKFASALFGLGTILVSYYLAREFYDEHSAIIAAALLALSAWHILGTTSISFDGAFLAFLYTLTILLFVRYVNTSKKIFLYLSGIAFGFSMLTKLNAILIVLILIVYVLLKDDKIRTLKDDKIRTLKDDKIRKTSRDYKRMISDFAIFGIIAIIVFSIFPIAAALTDWSYFTVVLGHTDAFLNSSLDIVLVLIQFMQAFFWIGPLFLGLYILKLFDYEKRDLLLHIWIAVVFLFFAFGVQENFRPVERYLLVLLPALCILGGRFISRVYEEVKKHSLLKHAALFIIVLVAFTALLFFLNLQSNEILPFYPKSAFVDSALSFRWNFLVPFTGDQGPVGMYVAFSSIAASFMLATIFLIIYLLIYRIKKHMKAALALGLMTAFLATSLSYNLFMWQEMSFGMTNPDIDKASKDAVGFSLENDLPGDVYIFRNYAMEYYLKDKYGELASIDFANLTEDNLGRIFEDGRQKSFIIIDFPHIPDDSRLWELLKEQCSLAHGYKDKGENIGYVYICS